MRDPANKLTPLLWKSIICRKKIVKEKLPKEELFLRGGNGLDNFSEKMKKREKKGGNWAVSPPLFKIDRV
jgi:hypothetical protein